MYLGPCTLGAGNVTKGNRRGNYAEGWERRASSLIASRILIMGRSGKVRPEAGYPQVTIKTRSHLIN
jgi:hypothetical protein